jgi:hypothetical protein
VTLLFPRDTWTWFGDAGHFICSPSIREKGEASEPSDIGRNRKFETMVFSAGKPCDVSGCGCGLPAIDGREIDFASYLDRASATRGHYALCDEWGTRSEVPA